MESVSHVLPPARPALSRLRVASPAVRLHLECSRLTPVHAELDIMMILPILFVCPATIVARPVFQGLPARPVILAH